jgi:hypothetical protein
LPRRATTRSPTSRPTPVVSTRTGGEEIWIAAQDGTNPVQLSSFGGSAGGTPRWSPDGTEIVFDWRRDGHADVFVARVDAPSAPRRLTSETSNELVPSWSCDGRFVYFSSDRSGRSQVWKVAAGGGPALQVTRQGGFEAQESPDGKWLYYEKDGAVWRMPVEGGEETRVVDRVGWGFWATTRTGICYLNQRGADRDTVELYDAATGRTRVVASIDKGLSVPSAPGFAIAPDETWLLLRRVDHGDYDIMLAEDFR